MIPRAQPWRGTVTPRLDADENPAEAARAIARLAERLAPCWQRPEAFHERKSELIAMARRLAKALEER